MVPLVRGLAPRVLVEKGAAWTQKYLAERQRDPEKRPPSERYGHKDVRVELRRMSGGKCFYCERHLTEREQEVDHYVEVAERPEDAFTWANLYLSCKPCNGSKAPNLSLPVTTCLDPCAPGVAPATHLTFVDEVVVAANDSAVGRNTIQKYSLDRDDLDLARGKALRDFLNALIKVKNNQLREGRADYSDDERAVLRLFADPRRPFSLMMAECLRRQGL